MQVSRAVDIALRALIVLADESDRHNTIERLAAELDVPVRYLGKTVRQLAALGWIETTRGKGGGICVSEAGRAVSVADVMRTLEENQPIVNCTTPMCPLLEARCRLQGILFKANEAFMAPLESVRIADLA